MADPDMAWRTLVDDIDLTSDEAWEPMFSPYHGRIVPCWMITQVARWRMGYREKELSR